jgi:hypothetical protein
MATGLALAAAVLALCAGKEPPQARRVMASGYYVREAEDREWRLRIVGETPSLCGAYMVIHDEAGKLLHHGEIPHGSHTADKPFVVTLPRDGRTGDYRIVIVGHQEDMLGLQTPITDLPLEVYGGTHFTVGHDPVAVYFRAPEGLTKLTVGAYAGHLQVIKDPGGLVADTKKGYVDKKGRNNLVDFQPEPETLYRIERQCFYFTAQPAIYLAFDPARWFAPSPKLQDVKWWEGVAP